MATTQGKPNILFIMGDDIGWFNVSAYNVGMMGYRTPNIDRIGREGAVFTDWYGQQSCTAGRAAFITGQSPIRTGLTKVGLPGAKLGLGPQDPSVGDVMKSLGYATGQFGKNHLGDRNEHLPTVHGFDEFFGNLYHLNAEEEPENPDYPKDPAFLKKFGPRGVLKCRASDKDDATDDPAFGRVGKQVIENTGATGKKRMETVDEEFLAAAKNFIERQHKAGAPWFCYFNSTRMHVFTHLKKESEGKTGLGVYPDGMVEHDGHVGQLLDLLDQLGVADNTIVVYTTDNGAECFTWPDGGSTPFRGEKATNWEGGFRVPCLIRWPGVIKPVQVINDICAHEDFIPTFAAAAGDTDLVARLKEGGKVNGKSFKVHLDGNKPDPVPVRQGKGESAQGVLLLERRRRPVGTACAAIQDHVHGATRRGQSEHLLRGLAGAPRVHPGARAGDRGEDARELQGFPAARQGGELHGQRRDGEDRDGGSEPELSQAVSCCARQVRSRT
jgi:arylsulfatase